MADSNTNSAAPKATVSKNTKSAKLAAALKKNMQRRKRMKQGNQSTNA